MTAPAGPGDGRDGSERGPGREEAFLGDTMCQFAGYMVNRLFSVGLSLESARSIVGEGLAGDRVAAATDEVDGMIRDIRTTMFGFAADCQNHPPHRRSLAEGQRPSAGLADRTAALQQRMAQTARTLQDAAADAAALLEQQAGLIGPPGRIDYPTEIKRWRAFADQAEQTAKRWEQQP